MRKNKRYNTTCPLVGNDCAGPEAKDIYESLCTDSGCGFCGHFVAQSPISNVELITEPKIQNVRGIDGWVLTDVGVAA